MKRLARFCSPFPELQRELYALPRWWVMMWGMLCFAALAAMVVFVLASGRGYPVTEELLHLLFALLIIPGTIAAATHGAIVGHRAAIASMADPLFRKTDFFRILSLLISAMPHLYLYLLASIPLFLYVSVADISTAPPLLILKIFIYAEGCMLFSAMLGIFLGVLGNRNPTAIAATILSLLVALLFFYTVVIWDSSLGELEDLIAYFIPLANIEIFDESSTISILAIEWPFWIIALFEQLLICLCCGLIVRDLLSHPGTWCPAKTTVSTLFIVTCMILSALFLDDESLLYQDLTGFFLIIFPLIMTPGHTALHQREIRLQNKSFFERISSSYGIFWHHLLFATAVLTASVLLQQILSARYPDLLLLCTTKVATALLFYLWACFIGALTEHCELYVRYRGRTLAALVMMLFVFAPFAVHQHSEIFAHISPFYWVDKLDSIARADERLLQIVEFMPLILQITVVGGSALGLYLWTEHQRKLMAIAQRKRIKEALAIDPADL